MSLNKKRKRLVKKLKKQDDKRLSKIRAWKLFEEIIRGNFFRNKKGKP